METANQRHWISQAKMNNDSDIPDECDEEERNDEREDESRQGSIEPNVNVATASLKSTSAQERKETSSAPLKSASIQELSKKEIAVENQEPRTNIV